MSYGVPVAPLGDEVIAEAWEKMPEEVRGFLFDLAGQDWSGMVHWRALSAHEQLEVLRVMVLLRKIAAHLP